MSAPRTASTAATPTSAAPVLNWPAPARSPSTTTTSTATGCSLGSTPGAGTTYTDATATEGTHDYAVLARDAAPTRACSPRSFKVVFDRPRRRAAAPRPRRCWRADQVNLAWPAASDALSGVAGYVVRRASGGTPPAAADGGTAVCAPAAPGCTDASAATGTWSYAVFARDAAGNVALIGTVANVVVVDKTPPLAPTKLTVTRAEGQDEGDEHHVHAALGQADGGRPRPRRRRAQPQARSRRARRRQARLPRPRHLGEGQAARRGRPATSPSTPTTTAATSRPSRCARS